MTFELLWTDKCFLSLLVISFLLILISLRKRPIRMSFSIILHRPLAVSAGIVLLFFITLGVLDSIHIYSSEDGTENAKSLLDKILDPIGSYL